MEKFCVLIGRISLSARVTGNLPGPDFSLNLLAWNFRKNNLSFTDMIALSGARTVGFSHCNRFSDRLYTPFVSPPFNPIYAIQLMQACPQNVDPSIAVNMDPITPRTFDNGYFKNLEQGRGMFKSDQVLFSEASLRGTVMRFADRPEDFAVAFAAAMVRLGRVGVKSGDQGEI